MRGDNIPPPEKARYYKYSWLILDAIPPIGVLDYGPKGGAFRMFSEGTFHSTYFYALPSEKSRTTLHALDYCAFCGATNKDVRLTDEHIIPEFLGAGLILPRATCTKCQSVTMKFENAISHQLFDPVRKHLGLQGKKRSTMRKRHFRMDRGRETTEHYLMPIEDHPTLLIMPRLYPASDYGSRLHRTNGMFDFLIYNLNADKTKLAQREIDILSTQFVDTVRFCQMISKIGHVSVVAHYGLSSFAPLVSDFIRTDFDKESTCSTHYDHVGCLWQTKDAPSSHLHEIEVGTLDWNGASFVAARVRLFAMYEMPSYYVAVARPL